MTIDEARKLKPGDQVRWTASREYTIAEVRISDVLGWGEQVSIDYADGILECPPHELELVPVADFRELAGDEPD